MTLQRTVEAGKADLYQDPEINSISQFVDADEFCSLAISSRNLQRSDDAGAALRGLFEVDTGIRYVIEERRLFEYWRQNGSSR